MTRRRPPRPSSVIGQLALPGLETSVVVDASMTADELIREALDETLFVEAGAGTGKTAALVARFGRLIATGRVTIDQIAAITFTEAAAAELRDRARMELERLAVDGDLAHDERARCAAAAAGVEQATITTIHGFAQRILAEHAMTANVPPTFRVLDEVAAEQRFRLRWQAFIGELVRSRVHEETVAFGLACGMTFGHLEDAARAMRAQLGALGGPARSSVPRPRIDVGPIVDPLLEAVAHGDHCRDPDDKLLAHLQMMRIVADRLDDAAGREGELAVMVELSDAPKLSSRLGRSPSWPAIDVVRGLLSRAEDAKVGLVASVQGWVMATLLEEVRRFLLDDSGRRRTGGELEFDDLVLGVRDLLRRSPRVVRELRRRFHRILIDEFQDTDPVQLEIAAILGSSEAPRVVGTDEAAGSTTDAARLPMLPMPAAGRIFAVGDPKQSIYRFRGADLAAYRRAAERWADRPVRLSANHRSVPGVIRFVNETFAVLMPTESMSSDESATGLTDDPQATYVPLEARRPETSPSPVRVIGQLDAPNADEARHQEAYAVADAMHAAVAEQWIVVDPVTNEERSARFSDMALLLPTRTSLPTLQRQLEAADIPYRVISSSLVFATNEVREVLAVLSAIDDPTDEVSLIAALRSPVFGCSDDELVAYRRAGGRWDITGPSVQRGDSTPSDGERARGVDRVLRSVERLRALHERRWWYGVGTFVDLVVDELRWRPVVSLQRRPEDALRRIDFLVERARWFADTIGESLGSFLRWCDDQVEIGARAVDAGSPRPDDDAVRILTIHGAKGLEFPIVFLAGMAAPIGAARVPTAVVVDGRIECSFGARWRSEGYQALVEHERAQAIAESIRLLYVATTRARDHLVISVHGSARSTGSFASELIRANVLEVADVWKPPAFADASTPVDRNIASTATRGIDDAVDPASEVDGITRERWLEDRRVLVSSTTPMPTSASALARLLSLDEQPDQWASDRWGAGQWARDQDERDDQADVEPPELTRPGRAGTVIGRVVHAVMQHVDLVRSSTESREQFEMHVRGLAGLFAASESIESEVETIVDRVLALLASPALRRAAEPTRRSWRELPLAAEIEGVIVEGYADLVIEVENGLELIDYKTDRIDTVDDLPRLVSRYRRQLAVYALALEAAAARPVCRALMVVATPVGAHEVEIADLAGAMGEVRAELSRQVTSALQRLR